MLRAIINNPYRILGVYSNSPKKELIANKGKMQAFLRVKKSMPFPLDLRGILPEVYRTQETVDMADSELVLSAERIKHAQFWFINKTPIDDIAFNHLTSGNIESAINLWKKTTNMSSLQNLFVCSLIKENYTLAIANYAIPLYNTYAESFVSLIDENTSISVSELVRTIVDTLSDNGVDIDRISSYITDTIWKTHIEEKRVNPLIVQLESYISDVISTKGKGANARLSAGNKLKIASKPQLTTLKSILPLDDTRYQIIADKVSQEVLQCSIDYYNDTSDIDSPAKALPLCEYAKSIAMGSAAKQRCVENYDVIKRAFDNMPPMEVVSEAKEIDALFEWYRKQAHTSANGLELLKKARKPLISMKEKIGNNHKYYLETSSALGSAALSNVIDEVNEAQKDDEPNPLDDLFGNSSYRLYSNIFGEQERRRQKAYRLKAALANAWKTIVHIDLLDTTEKFKKNRYQPNRKTLYSIIDGLKGFDYADDNYIIKGCARGIYADKKFFWCDSEYFAACTGKSDYKEYLQKFPTGNHVTEANKRIEEITEHEKKIRKYVLIAVTTIIFVIILVCTANAVTIKTEHINHSNSIENVYDINNASCPEESFPSGYNEDDTSSSYGTGYNTSDNEGLDENEIEEESDSQDDCNSDEESSDDEYNFEY